MIRLKQIDRSSSLARVGQQSGGNRILCAISPFVCCSALLLSVGCSRGTEPTDEAVGTATAAVEVASVSLSCAEKQALILDVLEKFVPFAETFWRTSDITEVNTGRYAATGSGVTQPRGAGDIAFAYVTLLNARPDQATFGGVTREVMIDHTIQSIRHEAYTNALSGKTYKKWGGGTWQASLETYSWAFAAHKLWGVLDEDTRTIVKKVVMAEADILITKALASGEEGDTGAEDNAWNSPTPALAAMMFPQEANATAWETAAKRLAINASSTTADATDSTTLVDGTPLSEWMGSVNLHPDLTMENHGFFNPIYQQVTHVDINDAAIAYGQAGRTLPEAFSFRTLSIWEDVLMRLATDEGDFAMPAGQDWISKDFQHLDYLGILATRLQRVDASVFESRALKLVAARQATFTNGSMLGQSAVGYETMLIKRLAALYWTHELFGPSPAPTQAEFDAVRAKADGVKSFPYSDFVGGRLGNAFVSMSWDAARPLALVVPHSADYQSDPLFAYYAPLNLLGAASGAIGAHSNDFGADWFSTAGSIGTRRFSMTAFPDGVALLLDRGTGSTFTYALESITGLTGTRSIWSAAGDTLGTLTGDWVNAADRLGMIVKGGAGLSAALVTGTNNQLVITGSTATGTGNRGAVLLPLVAHERTAALAPYAVQPTTPADWSALSGRVADDSLRFAVARWAGPAMAAIVLVDERGAPIPEEDATLASDQASFTAHLGLPASHGQTIRYFVDSTSALRGQQEGEDSAVIRNPNEQDATLNVTYAPASGTTATRERVLAAGEEVVARVLNGALTLAGPELEALVKAREGLASLNDQLPEETCNKHGGRGHGRGHDSARGHHQDSAASTLDDALAAIDAAIAEAQAVDPNERRLAWSIEHAARAVHKLEHLSAFRHLAPELRRAILAVIETAQASLRDAATASRAVSAWAVANNLAQPGELLNVQVTLFNRGSRHIRNGSVTLSGPDGWTATGPVLAFDELRPGESITVDLQIQVPLNAEVGQDVPLVAELSYDKGHREGVVLADFTATIDPIIDISPVAAKIPLGLGGLNQAPVSVTNLSDHALDITLTATSPDGIIVNNVPQTLSIPASSSVSVALLLQDLANSTGTGTMNVTAKTAAGAEMTSIIALSYSTDLALNAVSAPWPLATATSNQAAYPPSFAFDGNASTFWVSGGTVAGQGPTPTQPMILMVDFGVAQTIGSVTMVPRVGYGPKAYTIEVSNDGLTWTVAASIPAAVNATITTAITPVQARYLRLQMTAGWDKIQPPRNVQIIALNVRAPAL